jgi:hypothetical protein
LLVVIEFIIPIVRGKKGEPQQETKKDDVPVEDFTLALR